MLERVQVYHTMCLSYNETAEKNYITCIPLSLLYLRLYRSENSSTLCHLHFYKISPLWYFLALSSFHLRCFLRNPCTTTTQASSWQRSSTSGSSRWLSSWGVLARPFVSESAHTHPVPGWCRQDHFQSSVYQSSLSNCCLDLSEDFFLKDLWLFI